MALRVYSSSSYKGTLTWRGMNANIRCHGSVSIYFERLCQTREAAPIYEAGFSTWTINEPMFSSVRSYVLVASAIPKLHIGSEVQILNCRRDII